MKRDFGVYILIDNSPEEFLYAVKDMLRLTSYKYNVIKKENMKK